MSARIIGIIKVALVLSIDYAAIYSIFEDPGIATIAVGIIGLFVLFGGYFALLKEGAVSSKKLPSYQSARFDNAKAQLAADVKAKSGIDINGLKVFLVPGDSDMNATAYGFNCVSVTRGTFENADPITLNAVLAHEVSHILNLDPEFNRAVFCSVTLVVAALSAVSFVAMAIVFLIFLFLNCFRSFLGVLVFRGTTNLVSGLFGLLQRAVVIIYRTLLSLVSRHAEYRSDMYAHSLGYGLQLAHFLSMTESSVQRPLTISEAIYNSHPPTPKRIARLEQKMLESSHTDIAS
ncbi:MAG: M48 family metalloprotease [Firmicutes bacterium]|nr:M48 family metalloprotease [Bacillota bacterium]